LAIIHARRLSSNRFNFRALLLKGSTSSTPF